MKGIMDKDEALKAMKGSGTLKSHVLIMILFDTICFLSNPHNTPIQILKERLKYYLSQYEKDLSSFSVQYIQDHVDKIAEFLDKTFSYSSHEDFKTKLEEDLIVFDFHKDSPFNAFLVVIKSFMLSLCSIRNDPKAKNLLDLQQLMIDKLISEHVDVISEKDLLTITHLQGIFHKTFHNDSSHES